MKQTTVLHHYNNNRHRKLSFLFRRIFAASTLLQVVSLPIYKYSTIAFSFHTDLKVTKNIAIRSYRTITSSISSSLKMSSTQHVDHVPPHHVCIVGGGIVGVCTAYFLAKQYNISSTIIDRSGMIASAASGKAGGFLAYDWNDHTPTEQLTHRSFILHEQISQMLQPETIQYRKLSCIAMSVKQHNRASTTMSKPSGSKLHDVEWAASDMVQNVRTLGTEQTIAQVHPKLLCTRLWEETVRILPSCQLRQGAVVETIYETQNNPEKQYVVGVQLQDGTKIDADAVLYACGPWNIINEKTTGTLNTYISGVKYHSMVVPTTKVYNQCVFFSGGGDPEVYVRPDQTAYCTGFPDPSCIVTENPGQESIDPKKVSVLYEAIQHVSNNIDENDGISKHGLLLNQKHIVQQACYLPSTVDNIPIMGALTQPLQTTTNTNAQSKSVSSLSGLYIATGHSCWGILLGPATGECMASLIATGQSTNHVNLDAFRPSRFY